MDDNANEDMKYCLGCLNLSSSLYCYKLQNESLETIMQSHCLYLCYICKRLMQKAEQFIECVKYNQLVIQSAENIELNLSSKTLKTSYQFSAEEKVILENSGPNDVNDFDDSIYKVYGRSVDHKIIMNLKEENIDEVLHDLDIPESLEAHQNFFDNSIKVENIDIGEYFDESAEIRAKNSFASETTTTERSDTDSEYGSIAQDPLTTIEHKKCNVHKMCVAQSTDNGSRRLKKAPKSGAERGREFRARQKFLKQQSKQQQESDAKTEMTTEDIRSERTTEEREMSSEATRRWREKEKGVSNSSKKQAKTAAQRMREYRARQKLAKKKLLKEQSDPDLKMLLRK